MNEITTTAPGNALPVPMQLLQHALQNNAGLDVLERLMGLQERWETNEARKQYNAAIADARAELKPIIKTRRAGFDAKKEGGRRTEYQFEGLSDIADNVDEVLGRHGLSYRWRTTSEINEPVKVTCIVSHRAGHSEENTLTAGRDDSGSKNPIQAIGSTITYLQRYSLKAALGLAAAPDDDAHASDTPVELISDEQLVLLGDKLPTARSRQLFLDKYQIEKLNQLPADKFDEAMAAIDARTKRQQSEKT